MSNHNGENWPYHESRNGDMVACASNPCKIHGGNDIIATSPEEAYEKLHDHDTVPGLADQVVDAVMKSSSNKDSAPVRSDAALNPYGSLIEYTDNIHGRRTLMSDRFYGRAMWVECNDDGIPYGSHFDEPIDVTNAIRKTRECPRGLEGACKLYVDGVHVSVSNSVGRKVRFDIDDPQSDDDLRNKLLANGWVLDDTTTKDFGDRRGAFVVGGVHHEKSNPDEKPYPQGRTLRELGGTAPTSTGGWGNSWRDHSRAKAKSVDALGATTATMIAFYPQLADSKHWSERIDRDDITGPRGKKRVVEVDGFKGEFYPNRGGSDPHAAFIRITDKDGSSRIISDEYDNLMSSSPSR